MNTLLRGTEVLIMVACVYSFPHAMTIRNNSHSASTWLKHLRCVTLPTNCRLRLANIASTKRMS